jgi:hypothetical protein
MKTLIVFAIFAALMFLYIVYMSGEFSKSAKKLEAFEEAASSLKSEQTQSPTEEPPATTVKPTKTVTSTTAAPSTPTTATIATTSTTAAPTTTKKAKPTRDLEKTLFIVNAYEEIYGTKIGPDELEELNNMFSDVEDRDVIVYKLKELRSQSNEVDAIFELVDISNKLGSIVNRLKARAGARAEAQVSGELVSNLKEGSKAASSTTTTTSVPSTQTSSTTSTPATTATATATNMTTTFGPTTFAPTGTPQATNSTVEGYRPLPKYLSF